MGAELRFEDLLAPLDVESFFEIHHGRVWAHSQGGPDRFGDLISWDRLTDMLGMTGNWTVDSLRLFLDGQQVPAAHYCESVGAASGPAAMRPVPRLVMKHIQRGATLMAHHMDTASPGITRIAEVLETELGSKVDCALTCAWKGRAGLQPHFEVHDVYVVQVHGEQRWRIFETQVEGPVPNRHFLRGVAPLAGGEQAEQVTTRPGDLLYLPRGRYHDAVALSDASLHLAFGVLAFTGLELIQTLLVQAVNDPVFRRNFPRAEEGKDAFARHLATLGERIRTTVADPDFVARFAAYQRTQRTVRSGYTLPIDGDADRRANPGQQTGAERNG